MVEFWKPAPDYEDFYQVSDQGRVRRIAKGPHTHAGLILRPCDNGGGYACVALCRDGHAKTRTVHTLVAEVFLGPCPVGMEVNHKYGIKADNRLTELEYTTHSENVKHSYRVLGRKPYAPRGEINGRAKLTVAHVKQIRRLHAKGGVTCREFAKRYNVSCRTIAQIICRETWAHVA